jgi:hypothetical protein
MKVVKIKGVELVAENEFSKQFKLDGDIDLFLSKAIDDESGKHYIVTSIPLIKEVMCEHIQYPIQFNTTEDRDNAFNNFDLNYALNYVAETIRFIKEQKEKNDKSEREKKEGENTLEKKD